MLNSIITGTEITLEAFLICTAVSLVLGLGTAALCMFKNRSSQSFSLALAVLPVVVQTVIMLVNGNIGAGVAVAGTFTLVRFRSASGSAREICMIFLTMAMGLAVGMGYVGLAALLFLIVGAFVMILTALGFGAGRADRRELKITIAEGNDYDSIFDDLFAKYTTYAEETKVKTTNMGTLYELTYEIVMKDRSQTREFLDELRCRNGNLTITCGKPATREAL